MSEYGQTLSETADEYRRIAERAITHRDEAVVNALLAIETQVDRVATALEELTERSGT